MIDAPGQWRVCRRVAACLFAVAALVTLGLIAATAAPPASAITITIDGRTLLGTQSQPSYKPSSVTFVQDGFTWLVTGIRWRHWNSARAVGRGTASVAGFVARATLVASGRSYCTTVGAFLYDDLSMTLGARSG
jgi:hypothetical protein